MSKNCQHPRKEAKYQYIALTKSPQVSVAARWQIAFPTQHILGLQIWAAVEPNAVSPRVAVGRHINASYRVCNGLRQNETVRVGKNYGPVLSRLWTKVHEILRQRRRPFVLSNTLARLSMSHFIQQTFAIKSQNRRKTEQM